MPYSCLILPDFYFREKAETFTFNGYLLGQ